MRKTTRLAGVCAAFALPAFGATTASAATTGTLGNPTGTPVNSQCPAGTTVTGLRLGFDGLFVDGAAVLCSDGSVGPVIGSYASAVSTGDSTCAGAVVGIYGRSGSVVDAAGVRCGTSAGNTNGTLVGGGGGNPHGPFDCPVGARLTGVRGTSAPYINGTTVFSLTGLCSTPPLQLACSPAAVRLGAPSTCTATYTGATHPTGTVSFATNGSGSFSSQSCTLVLIGGNQARCSVTYTPHAVPPTQHKIYANYSGDANNSPSHTSTIIAAHA